MRASDVQHKHDLILMFFVFVFIFYCVLVIICWKFGHFFLKDRHNRKAGMGM